MFEVVDIINVDVWNIVQPYLSNILSFLAGIFSLFLIWIGKRIYDTKLRNPVKMYFLIPDKRCKLGYVEQDEEEHLVKKLILPSNSKLLVLIWYRPRVNYFEDMHYFGCEGELTKKPKIINYSNPFILKDNLQRIYYVDWHQYYHLITNKNRIRDEVYVDGFELQTFEEGEYEANVYVHTPTRLGRAKLKISVTDEPSTGVLCCSYKEEKRKIKNSLIKKHKKHKVGFVTC